MEQEKVAPSVPGAVGLHHPRWDNSVSPVPVTQCSVVCDSTLSEVLQRATDSRCPLHQIAPVFSGGFFCISYLKTLFYLLLLYREVGGYGCASVQVWSSEVNFVEPVLFFHLYMDSGN